MTGDERRARRRLLHLSLREVVGDDSPPDLLPRMREACEPAAGGGDERVISVPPERPLLRLWWIGLAAAVLAGVVIVGVRTGGPEIAPIGAEEIRGVVLDPDGREVPGVGVTLRIGWTHNRGIPALRTWLYAENRTTNADELGRFRIAGVPEDGTGMLFAGHEGQFGRARATAYPVIRLKEPGTLTGRLVAAEELRKRLRVTFVSAHPGAVARTRPGEDGRFTLSKLPTGPGTLLIGVGNFVIHQRSVVVRSGRETAVEVIDVGDGTPESSPDPLVMATRAELLDESGAPVADAQLSWSSPWADGWCGADENGVVKLEGGGVVIGPPPYFLRLSMVAPRYYGELIDVAGETARIRVRPLSVVRLGLTRDGVPFPASRLYYVTDGEHPRVYSVRKVEDEWQLPAPPGSGSLVAVTHTGEILERKLAVEKSTEPVSVNIDFD